MAIAINTKCSAKQMERGTFNDNLKSLMFICTANVFAQLISPMPAHSLVCEEIYLPGDQSSYFRTMGLCICTSISNFQPHPGHEFAFLHTHFTYTWQYGYPQSITCFSSLHSYMHTHSPATKEQPQPY